MKLVYNGAKMCIRDSVTIVSPIWVFALAAPMRAFCGEAAGKIRTADYILVHHTRG